MKRLLHIMLLLLPVSCLAQVSEDILKEFSGLGLPLICITTTDGTEPTSTGVLAPEGLIGASITDIVPKEAQMQIYRADTLWYDSGNYEKNESGIRIRHRGNTSAYYLENKPYKLSLEKKANLIEAEKGDTIDRRNKDWVLINEPQLLSIIAANMLSSLMNMEFTPRMEYVNVIVNDDYRGIYILSENVKRDKDCRIDVDKEEGYIIELDVYYWNEDFSIPSSLTDFQRWTLKYPKAEDLTEEQEANIRSDIQRLESAFTSSNYSEVIDAESFARWLLLHDIIGTYDPGGSNIFFARKDGEPSSLIRMPVAWDLGSSMQYQGEFSHSHQMMFFSQLFGNTTCMDFINAYLQEWRHVKKSGIIEEVQSFIQEFPSTPQGKGLARSFPLFSERWDYEDYDVESMMQELNDWFDIRKKWLDENIGVFLYIYYADIRKVIYNNRLIIVKDNNIFTPDGKRLK